MTLFSMFMNTVRLVTASCIDCGFLLLFRILLMLLLRLSFVLLLVPPLVNGLGVWI